MTEYKPENFIVLFHDSEIRFMSDKQSEVEAEKTKVEKEWPHLKWRVCSLADFGQECYEDGVAEGGLEND